MVESAALLVDEVLPHQAMRQWVLSVPFQLRFLLAKEPQVMGRVLRIVYRAIETYLIHQAGQTRKTAKTGAVTLDPTIWVGAESEYSFPHAVSGWRVHRESGFSGFSPQQAADFGNTDAMD